MTSNDITGLILAGGRGSRMDGLDKGLQTFNGLPLALHTLQRLRNSGQVGQIMISANRNLAAYEAFGVTVVPDGIANYAGPLAGILIGLERCETAFLVTVPCDTPRFPLDLVARLARSLEESNADMATASAPEVDAEGCLQVRLQPVFCLLRTELVACLKNFTDNGGRKICDWTSRCNTVAVPFDSVNDDPRAFCNVNTLSALRQLENSCT